MNSMGRQFILVPLKCYGIEYRSLANLEGLSTSTYMYTDHMRFQALQQYLAWHYGQIDFYFDPHVPYWVPTPGANGRAGMILGLLFAFVLPFVIEVTLNFHIINIVRQMRSTTSTRTLKAVKTVLMTLSGYYICCIPMAVLTVWKGIVLTSAEPAEWLVFLAVQSLMLISGMSGIIYYLTLPDFKETLMNIIYCQHN